MSGQQKKSSCAFASGSHPCQRSHKSPKTKRRTEISDNFHHSVDERQLLYRKCDRSTSETRAAGPLVEEPARVDISTQWRPTCEEHLCPCTPLPSPPEDSCESKNKASTEVSDNCLCTPVHTSTPYMLYFFGSRSRKNSKCDDGCPMQIRRSMKPVLKPPKLSGSL